MQDDIGVEDIFSASRPEQLALLEPFPHMWDAHFRHVKARQHRMEVTTESTQMFQPLYWAYATQRAKERKEATILLLLDVIEPANAEWASPFVVIPKKDGSLRLRFYSRQFSKMKKRNTYPIPSMEECIDSLGDAELFTTFE